MSSRNAHSLQATDAPFYGVKPESQRFDGSCNHSGIVFHRSSGDNLRDIGTQMGGAKIQNQ